MNLQNIAVCVLEMTVPSHGLSWKGIIIFCNSGQKLCLTKKGKFGLFLSIYFRAEDKLSCYVFWKLFWPIETKNANTKTG